MKAAVLESPGQLKIAEVDQPRPNDYQALVRMESCGVCSGTDVHILEGKVPFPIDHPSIFGHESVGQVVEVGKRVRKYRVGDRVLRPCAIYPGQKMGNLGSSWGGYAEYGLITDVESWRVEEPTADHGKYWYSRLQIRSPQDLPLLDACMLITWKETFSALHALGPVNGKHVAIIGDGAVGLSFGQWIGGMGCDSLTVIGRREFRLERARKLGAEILNTHQDPLPKSRVFDVVVDTIGSSQSIQQMLPTLRDKGQIGVYGVPDTFRVEFDRSQGPHTWSLVQINPDEAACHNEVLAIMKKHGFSAADYVTCEESLDNLPKAMAHLREPQSIKAVIRF